MCLIWDNTIHIFGREFCTFIVGFWRLTPQGQTGQKMRQGPSSEIRHQMEGGGAQWTSLCGQGQSFRRVETNSPLCSGSMFSGPRGPLTTAAMAKCHTPEPNRNLLSPIPEDENLKSKYLHLPALSEERTIPCLSSSCCGLLWICCHLWGFLTGGGIIPITWCLHPKAPFCKDTDYWIRVHNILV